MVLPAPDGPPRRTVPQEGNQEASFGWSSAWHCARYGEIETLKFLIRSDPSARDALNSLKETPLHVACSHGQFEIAQILLDSGAFPFRLNQDGRTPAMLAVLSLHSRTFMILCDNNAVLIEHVPELRKLAARNGDKAMLAALSQFESQKNLPFFPQKDSRNEIMMKKINSKMLEDERSIAAKMKTNAEASKKNVTTSANTVLDLPPMQEWNAEHCARWVREFVDVDKHEAQKLALIFERFNLNGLVFLRLKRMHLISLLQVMGVSPCQRGAIADGIAELSYDNEKEANEDDAKETDNDDDGSDDDEENSTTKHFGPGFKLATDLKRGNSVEMKIQFHAIVVGVGSRCGFRICNVLESLSPIHNFAEIRKLVGKDLNKKSFVDLASGGRMPKSEEANRVLGSHAFVVMN